MKRYYGDLTNQNKPKVYTTLYVYYSTDCTSTKYILVELSFTAVRAGHSSLSPKFVTPHFFHFPGTTSMYSVPKYLFFTPHSLLQTHSLLTGSSGNDLLVQGSKELDRITIEREMAWQSTKYSAFKMEK